MAIITSISNTANAEYNGSTITSEAANTVLSLDPTITKSVDKSTASIDDVLTYTVVISNVSELEISNVTFSDTVPAGASYVTGSFQVDGATVTPTISGSTITYSIPSIASSGSSNITFQARVVGGES